MGVNVLCRYSISGCRVTSDPALQISSCGTASSVSLELKWDKLSVTVPLQEASTKVVCKLGHEYFADKMTCVFLLFSFSLLACSSCSWAFIKPCQ